MKFVEYILALIVVCYLTGCTLGHQKFYSQIAPEKFPPTNKVYIFEYSNVDIDQLYKVLLSDYFLIGRSSFNGPYEKPSKSGSFARSIGADVFIVSTQFSDSRLSLVPLTTPTVTTTNLNGYSGGRYFYGTATSYGTSTTQIPVTVNRYNQNGMYLKNVNNIKPLWEETKQSYNNTGESIFDGKWFNERYEIEIYSSENQVVAFITNLKEDSPGWKLGDLKMIFNPDTGTGIYLMSDKTPMPASIVLNKFGYLEVKFMTSKESTSFAKIK